MKTALPTISQSVIDALPLLKAVAERPRLEAELLMAHILGCDRSWLHAHGDDTLSPEQHQRFATLIARRSDDEPIAYLTGEAGFYSRMFKVTPGVLIPRPETECLIDAVLAITDPRIPLHIAEIGTGSGIIAVTLALALPNATFSVTDINPKALTLARENARHFGVEDQITFHHTSLLEGICASFDMIVSNPPYIAQDYPLSKTVLHEPGEALFGGERGDEVLIQILDTAKARTVPWIVCEMGYDQREMIRAHTEAHTPGQLRFYRDLAGLDRGFTLRMDR